MSQKKLSKHIFVKVLKFLLPTKRYLGRINTVSHNRFRSHFTILDMHPIKFVLLPIINKRRIIFSINLTLNMYWTRSCEFRFSFECSYCSYLIKRGRSKPKWRISWQATVGLHDMRSMTRKVKGCGYTKKYCKQGFSSDGAPFLWSPN